ncbi:ScbA/BarX family gamma-butyrolactone biosynthesis protein [Streptomyces sp. NPDC017448]|uniref:ScbA/BarX family gamma-butyrolactone biosynthesis protein n=1 Tax=Streptomyces sp. NPDC017448 TaxID=3364996 RepID=UPI0037B50FEC
MLGTDDRLTTVKPTPTTTVANQYAHRPPPTDIHLTGWKKTGPDSHLVSARWPRRHSFYHSPHGVHDPLLLCESLRRCGLLLTRTTLKTPPGHHPTWTSLRYSANPAALRITTTPTTIEMHAQHTEIHYQGTLPTTTTLRVEVILDAALLAVATLTFDRPTPPTHHHHPTPPPHPPTPPIPPTTAGRTRKQDVVLSPTDDPHRWRLRPTPHHPTLLPHPTPHAPHMLLLEAIRQASHATHPTHPTHTPTTMHATFHRPTHLHHPCWIETETHPTPTPNKTNKTTKTTHINALQHGHLTLTATTHLTPPT